MKKIEELLESNKQWSQRIQREDPEFFNRLAAQQTPEYLWIGCSDSRVPANQIINMMPGEVFVHRNIANVVVHTDLNCLSVIQYAIEVLQVKHVLVVGHYGCAGVMAALQRTRLGLVDNWIRHVTDVAFKHEDVLDGMANEELRHDRLCELNVLEQVANVCQTTIVRDAWARGQSLSIHGWVYTLRDGRVHDLGMDISSHEEFPSKYAAALKRIRNDHEDR